MTDVSRCVQKVGLRWSQDSASRQCMSLDCELKKLVKDGNRYGTCHTDIMERRPKKGSVVSRDNSSCGSPVSAKPQRHRHAAQGERTLRQERKQYQVKELWQRRQQ